MEAVLYQTLEVLTQQSQTLTQEKRKNEKQKGASHSYPQLRGLRYLLKSCVSQHDMVVSAVSMCCLV